MKKILLLSLVLSFFLSACQDNKANVALGMLERDRIAHTATVNEVIIALPIKSGSQVKKGQVLVELDKTLQQSQVSYAKAELLKAQAVLDKLRNGVRPEEIAAASASVMRAKAALLESESNFNRIKNLASKNLISQADLTKASALKDEALADYHLVKENLKKLTNGTRWEDLAIGDAQLLAAKAMLVREEKKLQDLTITATRDGILDDLPWNLGERVTIGSPIAIILAGKAPYARVYIPETYRVKIKVGQKLIIRVDGLSQSIQGTIRWVANEAAFSPYYALNQKDRARLMYLAEVQLTDKYSYLPNGLPVQVELP